MCASCNPPAPPIAEGPLKDSLGILEAFGEHHMAVIPTEPTGDMLRAGTIVGHVSPSTVRAIWDAMVKAAP